MKKTICFIFAICMLAACSKPANTERAQVKSVQSDTGHVVVASEPADSVNVTETVVMAEFARLLRNRWSWMPETGEVGRYVKAIPNLGPKGETTVHVCIGGMFDADCIFLVTNSQWDAPDAFETSDCLFLGAEELMDEYGEYRMTYDIHDSVLTINTKEISMAGTMSVTHTYSVRYWTFRYLSSDTVLYGDTVYMGGVFDPRKAHLGYKITDPMQHPDEPSIYNDPRWVYAEEKLWDNEVCAYLCYLAGIADGALGEVLDYLLFESLHNNPETNRCMAVYLATLPASEQELLLQVLLRAIGMSIYDYTDPKEEQLINPDFDSFVKAFPVFDSPYNSKVKQTYNATENANIENER